MRPARRKAFARESQGACIRPLTRTVGVSPNVSSKAPSQDAVTPAASPDPATRAGLRPWTKLFQNLRSTRETELCDRFPEHVVCKWIGNSRAVAAEHYLQLTDEHFARAAAEPTGALQNAMQSVQECRGKARQGREVGQGNRALRGTERQDDASRCALVGDTGLEQESVSALQAKGLGKRGNQSGTQSGTVDAESADLDAFAETLRGLPADTLAALLAKVQTAAPEAAGSRRSRADSEG